MIRSRRECRQRNQIRQAYYLCQRMDCGKEAVWNDNRRDDKAQEGIRIHE
jgi:hypothetical protein